MAESIRNERVGRSHGLWVGLATACGCVLVAMTHPMRAVGAHGALDHDVPALYMLNAFPFFGILWADFVMAWRAAPRERATRVLGVQVGAVALFAVLRLGLRVPISGHAVLLAFVVLHGWDWPRTTLRRVEWWAAAATLGWVLWMKWVMWHDFVTSVAGLIVALGIHAAGRKLLDSTRLPPAGGRGARRAARPGGRRARAGEPPRPGSCPAADPARSASDAGGVDRPAGPRG